MIDLDQFRQTFFEECDDCLGILETQLMAFQSGEATSECIEEAFRAIHSIKGGAGAFGFKRIIAFSHEFETLLDQVRDGRLELTDDVKSAALRAFDILTDLINGERDGVAPALDHETGAADELSALLVEASGDRPANLLQAESAEPAASADPGRLRRYNIRFIPAPAMLQRGNEPILLIRELKLLGPLSVDLDDARLPALEQIEPPLCYFGWTMHLESRCSQAAVEEIFEFVEGDCELEITELPADFEHAVAGKANIAEPEASDEITQSPEKAPEKAALTSIRVDLERIDRMVNMVGEIVIAQAAILQQADDSLSVSHPELVESLQQFMRHTQNLQDSVMAIRAQPVRSIFARMPRLVRELAQQTGKTVRLETSGEDTEIDKTVIEKLNDPLTHMIRNSVDHGIEACEQRLAAGKPEEGVLRLSASQRGSHIVIELSDDGKGLDRNAIRRKAIERGLVSADAQLSDHDVENLILKPGFSTSESVSDLSGRGVGMDVVNENIKKLGGRVAVRSVEGEGSTITLILPLTLAVMDGMVVRIGPTSFVIPLTSIVESLALRTNDTAFLPGLGEVLRFRDDYLKIYDLHKLFGFPISDVDLDLLMVIESDDGRLIGVRVDEIVGQQQIVVKSLEDNYSNTPCVAGGSIMGNGEVALILDPSGFNDLEQARRVPEPENHGPGQPSAEEKVA